MSAQNSAVPQDPAAPREPPDATSGQNPVVSTDERERLRRWRLLLGSPADEGASGLSAAEQAIDAALAALYNDDPGVGVGGRQGRRGASNGQPGRSAGLGGSARKVAPRSFDGRRVVPGAYITSSRTPGAS